MPSTPEKPQRSSGTSKHVHWEDAKKSASNFARSFRPSRRPVTPYPKEEEEEEEEKPKREPVTSTKEKRQSRSTKTSAPRTVEGIPIVFGDPIVLQPVGVDPKQAMQYLPLYQAFVRNKDGMAVPYEKAIPGYTRVDFRPQVADTTNGPKAHYFVPVEGASAGVPLQAVQASVAFQPIPVAVAAHPGVAIPLQQVATPQPATQQPIPQPVMQGFTLPSFVGHPDSALPRHMPMFFQSPQQMIPGTPLTMQPVPLQPSFHTEPALGAGATGSEAANKDIDKPQDFRPADDNPSRMYRVREVDGTWTIRNRFTIDRMEGEFRWYITDEGVFYAVRLLN